jgi:hypothetical protein
VQLFRAVTKPFGNPSTKLKAPLQEKGRQLTFLTDSKRLWIQPVATGSNHPIRSSRIDLAALGPKPSRPLKPSRQSPFVAALAESSKKQNDSTWPIRDRLVFAVNVK